MFGSIVEAIKYYSETSPRHLCFVDDDAEITYNDYYVLIRRIAYILQKMGIHNGSRVVIEAKQSHVFLAIEHALHLLGAIFVPLEHRCGNSKLKSVYYLTEANLIISENKIEEMGISYDELIIMVEKQSQLIDYKLPSSDDVSEILFSTGTTGKEKGIVLTHSSDVAVAQNIILAVKLNSNNIELIPSPFNHSHGLRSYYANVLMGGTVITLSNLMDMQRFFHLLDKYQVNAIDLVPAALALILRLSKNKMGDYKNILKYIEFGSSAIAKADKMKIKELLPNVPLYNFYGSTESGRVTVYDFNQLVEKQGCIGKPTCNVTLKLVDDSKKEVDGRPDSTGCIATKGAMNMAGYYNDELETNQAMHNGFIVSKDEAYIDSDGDIILVGRKGDVLNIGGKKVSPEEIENVVKQISWIDDCACIGIPHELLGTQPKLFIKISNSKQKDINELKQHLIKNLEPFKVPHIIEEIDCIPRTFNGKLLRKNLQR